MKKEFVFILACAITLAAVQPLAVFAENNAKPPNEKIAFDLQAESISDKDTIPVVVWYKDYEQYEAESLIEEKIGYSIQDHGDGTISIMQTYNGTQYALGINGNSTASGTDQASYKNIKLYLADFDNDGEVSAIDASLLDVYLSKEE